MGQYWRQLQRQAWVPRTLLAGRCWLKHPATEGSAWLWLWRSAATSSAAQGHGQGSTRMVRTATPAKDLPSSQQQLQQAWQRVMAFQQQHSRLPRAKGDSSCPLVPEERRLGLWCADQQRRKAGSKDPPLTALQQAGLAAIPGWAWWARQGVQASWEQRLQQLEAFVRQQGRLPRQTASNADTFMPGEQELGRWVNTQCKRYKGQERSQLSNEQVTALETLPGWTWGKFQQPWGGWCQQVEGFVQQYGRLPRGKAGMGKPLVPGEEELARWCSIQRRRWKGDSHRGPPSLGEQQAALEAVPGWWWEKSSHWEAQCQQVAAFANRHERLPRTLGSERAPLVADEKELGAWCNTQRQRWSGNLQSTLTAEQQGALAAIPGWAWRVRDDRWEQRREQLEGFVRQQGRLPRRQGSNVAPLVPLEKELGAWCGTQRQHWSGSLQPPLMAERQAALAAIPGWAWNIRRDRWELRREQLETFVRQRGCLPRRHGSKGPHLVSLEKELGVWCTTQRQRWSGSYQPPLTAEQRAALAAIPGWAWNVRYNWEERRKQLEAFVQEQGRLPRQQGRKGAPLVSGEKELATWCDNQRQRWRSTPQSALSAKQQAALAAVPGWAWNVRRDRWEVRRKQLEAFVWQHGRLPRQQGSKGPLLSQEKELGAWCNTQRQRWRGNIQPTLTAEQQAAVAAIPSWAWKVRRDRREQQR